MSETDVLDLDYLGSLPEEWPADLLPEIRREVADSGYKLVILDDDPTGTQTVRDIPVLTVWTEEALAHELQNSCSAFFILTNSRSMVATEACRLGEELGTNLGKASARTGVRVVVISRSDSTLRGHFPAEVDAVGRVLGSGARPYLIAPFFLEGGRYTVNDIHYVQEGETLVPAALTPFARDDAFGFKHSDLKRWVEEKTGGSLPASSVVSISIEDIRRGGPDTVRDKLSQVQDRGACIVNSASYRDMEVVVAALLAHERGGGEFLYRTAASFVRTRLGMDAAGKLLTRDELVADTGHGGLFVVGSYVPKTSEQLAYLLQHSDTVPLEMEVERLLDERSRSGEILRVSREVGQTLADGKDVAMFTSRTLITGRDSEESLEIGRIVSDSLIEVVRQLTVRPRFLVAKGGITSSDVATKGLGVRRAMVLGQILPGVPVWQLGEETRYPGMSYIVFPGNVGSEQALVQAKKVMTLE